jgi:threonine dehydratase
VQALDDLYLAPEDEIIYWTQWLNHLLKVRVEPTSAVTMSGVTRYLQTVATPQNVLILLSGGNMDRDSEAAIWQEDHLINVPCLN